MAPYHQGKALAVDFWDCAVPIGTGQSMCVPAGCFNGVLRTNEWGPLDPAGGIQAKLYAPGTGLIKIFELGNAAGEFLELTRIRSLGRDQREEANDQALRLDGRGYRFGGPAYAATAHAVCQQFC
ncbi:MAG: hypothetical protein HW416_2762 [Chloroflexi bacterium]|nr:hypothetical protein [Chloroflexota bacterium]